MNRTQKKCLIASSGFHALLLVILFVGPAFLSPKDKPDNLPVLTFIPIITTDAEVQGGGNPKARPPAPTPSPAEPPKPEIKETKPDPGPPEPKRNVKPRLPQVSTELKTRSRDTKATAKQTNSKADSQARADAKAREQFQSSLSNLRQNLSGTTTVELPGPGGGGLPYANFLQAVKTVYSDAWEVPDGVTDDSATTTASVTIARDGTVISSRIIQSSGNALADQSVQITLDRVKFAAPLPRNAKENQRTVTIKFNVRAKRMVG
jgi:TonB family protein